jgi:glycosyltransferase involved in cell wall biosynthesis
MDTMNIAALTASIGLNVPVIVSERNDPLQSISGARRIIRDQLYRIADLIVCQTQQAASYFPESYQSKIRIIPNPVFESASKARPAIAASNGRFRIVSVGRLAAQKGQDLLIDSFAQIAGNWPNWDLVIFGEGPCRAELVDQVNKLNLHGRITFPGVIKDVSSALAASHIMAFPSRYEGFPNALAEGLAAALPSIGYRGVSGVADLILPGKTGLLVNPEEGIGGFAHALSRLLEDADLRVRLGNAGCMHVSKWAPDHVLSAWDDLIREVTIDAAASRSL